MGSSAVAGEQPMIAANTEVNANVFDLGRIETVTITGSQLSNAINESKITADDIYKFNALTVDRAIDLTTGAVSGSTGGPRNERLFFIRGFDRFQSTLSVDGIRVYLPADNRLDVGLFLTANLAQIQVDKGYVSVLSGPGSIGGALNLVTRRPTQPFEYEARAGFALAGNGEFNGYNVSGLVGGATGSDYWEASGGYTKTDHWRLSDKFTPTISEDGGIRDHSEAHNYALNLKYGWTPNATDEYSFSYSGQWAEKNATLSITDPVATQRDWRWPYWDVQSLYFLSNTAIRQAAYVKTRLYYNSFRNGLNSYDNANYNSQTTAKAFNSYYSDYAFGGSVEVGNNFFNSRDILKGAFFFRGDTHVEWQQLFAPKFTEPKQESDEDTYSVAAENRLHVTDRVDFVVGASYDWRRLLKAQDYVDPTVAKPASGGYVNYPLANGQAANVQGALIFNYSGTGHVYANVSDRERFPTLFERFSTRFNTTLSNPNLKAERAINYEIGGGDTFFHGTTRMDGAVFYSDVRDALVNVPIDFCDTTSALPPNCVGAGGKPGRLTSTMTPPVNVSQTQNVGDGKYYGFEFSADSRIIDTVQIGVRYTYINRNIDAQNPANPPVPPTFHLTGVPYSQLFAYVTWDVTRRLSLTPNLQLASDRWSNTSSGNGYFKTGSFTLLNFEAEYAVTDRIDVQVGARNLLDSNYQLVLGFPSEGRNFFVNLRIRSG